MIRRNGFRQTIVMPPRQVATAPTPCPEPTPPEFIGVSFVDGYESSKPDSTVGGDYVLFDDGPFPDTARTITTSSEAGTLSGNAFAILSAFGGADLPTWRVAFAPAASGPVGGDVLASVEWGANALALSFSSGSGNFAFGAYSVYATIDGTEYGPAVLTFAYSAGD